MSTLAANKRKGATAEIALTDWLIAHGYAAVRLHLAGRDDEGDIMILHGNATVTIIEVKHCTRMDIAAWLRELDREIANTRIGRPGVTVHGLLVIRPNGTPNPSQWWAIQRLDHALPERPQP